MNINRSGLFWGLLLIGGGQLHWQSRWATLTHSPRRCG